ncbi:hypothetical protein LAZ67_1000515 [Cordylochernes scorpioides]|uniref:PiggyBac transposable element-derived protein 4 n=1 Tax=Cordylochernes scorpioides TaxID=51811 RepID=A0ABY6JUR9_9ARAC|nr:hypothetical protein LAZ67_1000515 [Cordylochernes scorpioides]
MIGCKCFAVDNRPFAPRSEEYRLVGYSPESKAYRLWKPGTNIVGGEIQPESLSQKDSRQSGSRRRKEETRPCRRFREKRTIRNNGSHLAERKRKTKNFTTGKPGRPRKEYVEANLSKDFRLNTSLPDPKDLDQALSSEDLHLWKRAMKEEYSSLLKNGTWELVDPPKNKNIIGNKWVFQKKFRADGSIERYKARLVAKGYSQKYGIDYEETFAPIVRHHSTIRTVLALAVEYDLLLHQMDVQSAFLNSDVKEEIYMTQPENFESKKYPRRVCKLKKAIYGLKQAGKTWHAKLDSVLKEMGLEQMKTDNCVYIKREGVLLVAIYVDDMIVAAEEENTLICFKESMKKLFKINDLGALNYCLGIQCFIKCLLSINLWRLHFASASANWDKAPLHTGAVDGLGNRERQPDYACARDVIRDSGHSRECSAFSEDTEVYSLSSEFEESVEDTFEDEFSDEEVDENQPSPWVRVYTPFSTSKTLTFGEVCGPQHLPPSIIRPIEYFLLFITMNLMKEIVAFTNKCAQTLLASNRDKLPPFSRKLAWKDTTLDEMMAFIGVIFNMGNVKKNQIRDYWSKNELLETPWFGKVMSRGRFELLYSCFSLIDDFNLVPSSHPDYNPTARFEKLIEHVNNKFIYYYKPTQNLTVDESLVCLKNRTRLRQYMPQKHHGRFGVKLWMLCESKTGYCLRMKPYKGKLSPIIKSLSYDVPMNLLQESSLLGKGYHLITDNFFTSINLAKDLLDSHTYLTGTIRTNRKGLPKTLTSAKLGVDDSLYMVNNNLLALAYKEKKSKPPVKFLSTFCDASSGKKKVSDQRDYPQMKICYDSYMGGVDLNDQMLYTYMDERKGRKFYRKVILNIFHRALLNSFILYEQHTKDNPKLSRRAFNYSVINELVKNHLKPPVLPSTSQEVLEKLPEKRESRCLECTKEGLKRRSRTICSKCKRGLHPVCAFKHKC